GHPREAQDTVFAGGCQRRVRAGHRGWPPRPAAGARRGGGQGGTGLLPRGGRPLVRAALACEIARSGATACDKLLELKASCPVVVAMESSGTYGDPLRQALGDAAGTGKGSLLIVICGTVRLFSWAGPAGGGVA